MVTLRFGAAPSLPSAVFAGPDGMLRTGTDAEQAAQPWPAGLEANPKRRVDETTVWLGERAHPVVDLIGAVLRRVADEAVRVRGCRPDAVVLTYPAAWGRVRLDVLARAAAGAGLSRVTFVPEPVAAAAYVAAVLGRDLRPGQSVVVYDFGAGTVDVAIVRHTPEGLQVVASGGLDDVGGLDVDAVVVDHARRTSPGTSAAWGRLDWPQTDEDQRLRRELWHGARTAKERLSRQSTAEFPLPLVGTDALLTREEFDQTVRGLLDRTVDLTVGVLRRSAIPREQVAGVFLVGGSARIPLVSTLLHRAMRIEPTLIEQPELVAAVGSLVAFAAPAAAAPAGRCQPQRSQCHPPRRRRGPGQVTVGEAHP